MNLQYKLRRLKYPQDKEDIIEMCKEVFNGNDYVPYLWHLWVDDPNCYFTGMEIDGHIVACNRMAIIDDGKTGWVDSLRVHPNFWGKNLATLLVQDAIKYVQDNLPNVDKIRETVNDINIPSIKVAKKLNFQVYYTLNVCRIKILDSLLLNIKSEIQRYNILAREIIKLNESDINIILNDADLRKLVGNCIQNNWKIYDYSEYGFHYAFKYHECEMFVERVSGKTVSFSCGWLGKNSNDINGSWSISIYAETVEQFLTHFNKQIEMKQKKNLIDFEIIYLSDAEIDKLFERILIGIDDNAIDKYYSGIKELLFELKIKK